MRGLSFVVVLAAACSQQTGFLLDISGPEGTSSVAAGITELRLVVAHASYCDRLVADEVASSLRVSVAGRDLGANPVTILVEPDHVTDLADPVTAMVLALGSDGHVLGVAAFDAHPFVFKQVQKYTAHIGLYGPGSKAGGPQYLAADGDCLCAPGLPQIGNGSGQSCDPRIPPSFDALVHTAGCELPSGADLPLGVCDGQLYPGERENRTLPCYATVSGSCRIATRTCTDKNGIAYDRECIPGDATLTLPTSALCDAFSGCEQDACVDPLDCMKKTVTPHHTLACTLPVSPTAMAGAAQPCDDGDWLLPLVPAATGTACVAAMLDGMRQGPVTIGWLSDGKTTPTVSSALCPPTLVVSSIESNPSMLPTEEFFSLSLGDEIYDVTLTLDVACPGVAGNPSRKLRCTGL